MKNTFITYEQALTILHENRSEFSTETRALEECIGGYLAEDLIADRDFPPFDRVTMDGIAIAHKQFESGQREYVIESVAAAGNPKKRLFDSKKCIEVMTGAIMPEGVDTIIRYEDLEIKGQDESAIIRLEHLKQGQNVHFKGSDIPQKTIIVSKGKKISSAEINIAATVGKPSLHLKKLPNTVICTTGDELVDLNEKPQAHQIRKSNSYAIQSMLRKYDMKADLFHLKDDKDNMLHEIKGLLENYDVLIFSGGVSKGKYDYLPEVLETLQIEKYFHKVQQRPGKPFWFGGTTTGKTIFALPGNPVSSFVCTAIYVKYWLEKSLGIQQEKVFVRLGSEIHFKPELTYFLEVKLESRPDGLLIAHPFKGNGSGDFTNLVKTDGFLVLTKNQSYFKEGEVIEFVGYRNRF